MAAPTPFPIRYDNSTGVNKLIFPPNGLPTRKGKLDKEWARVTQYIGHVLRKDCEPIAYDSNSTEYFKLRKEIAELAMDRLMDIARDKLTSKIAEKFNDHGKTWKDKQNQIHQFSDFKHFGPMFENMKPEYDMDRLGTLKLIYEIVVKTIESIDWKVEAVDQFCNEYDITYDVELDKTGRQGIKGSHCLLLIVGDAPTKGAQRTFQTTMDKYLGCSLRSSKVNAAEVTLWDVLPIDQKLRRSHRSKASVHIRYTSQNPPSTPELLYEYYVLQLAKASNEMGYLAGKVTNDVHRKMLELSTAQPSKLPAANNTKPAAATTQPQLNTKHTQSLVAQQPLNNYPYGVTAPLPINNNPLNVPPDWLTINNNSLDMPPLSPILGKHSEMKMGALLYDSQQQAAANMALLMSQVPPHQMLPIQQQPAQPTLNQPNTTMALSTQQLVAAAAVVQQAAVNKTTEASMEQDVTAAAVQQAPFKAAEAPPRMELGPPKVSCARQGQEDISLAEETLHVELQSVSEDKQHQAEAAKNADAEALRVGQKDVPPQQQVMAVKASCVELEAAEDQQQEEAAKNKATAVSATTAAFLAENNGVTDDTNSKSATETSTVSVPKASTNDAGTKSSSDYEDAGNKSSTEEETPRKVAFQKGDKVVGKFGDDDDYVWYKGKVTTGRKKGNKYEVRWSDKQVSYHSASVLQGWACVNDVLTIALMLPSYRRIPSTKPSISL